MINIDKYTWQCPKCRATISKEVEECPICITDFKNKIKRKRRFEHLEKIEHPTRKGTKDAEKLKRPIKVKFCYNCRKLKSVVDFRSKGWTQGKTMILLERECRTCEAKKRIKITLDNNS